MDEAEKNTFHKLAERFKAISFGEKAIIKKENGVALLIPDDCIFRDKIGYSSGDILGLYAGFKYTIGTFLITRPTGEEFEDLADAYVYRHICETFLETAEYYKSLLSSVDEDKAKGSADYDVLNALIEQATKSLELLDGLNDGYFSAHDESDEVVN